MKVKQLYDDVYSLSCELSSGAISKKKAADEFRKLTSQWRELNANILFLADHLIAIKQRIEAMEK